MTDEELAKELQDISGSIENLPESDEPLTKEEKRHRDVLLLKKETLERIKEAKAKRHTNEEIYNSIAYALLTSWGAKHPYLMTLVLARFRWNTI